MSREAVKSGEKATSLRYQMMELAATMDNVISLGRGDPDLDTPTSLWRDALHRLSQKPASMSVRGELGLRRAIAHRYSDEKGMNVDPETEIVVTNGAQEGLFLAMLALLNHGDVVATPDPRYSSYDQAIGAAGGSLVQVPTGPDQDFKLQPEDLRKYAANAKVLVFVNPSNPTGGFVERDGVIALAEAAAELDLIVVADEIYEDIVYDQKKLLPIASCAGMRDRTVTLSGFSKSYAMTGFRVGYLVGHPTFVDAVSRIKSAISGPCPLFSQYTALAALEQQTGVRESFLETYEQRRRVLMDGLNAMNIPYGHMGGGLFMWANVTRFGVDAERFCFDLLEQTGVLMFPGNSFGDRWTNWVRISLLAPVQEIEDAMARMQRYVSSIS